MLCLGMDGSFKTGSDRIAAQTTPESQMSQGGNWREMANWWLRLGWCTELAFSWPLLTLRARTCKNNMQIHHHHPYVNIIYIYRHIHECQKSSIKIHPSSITSRPADLRQSVRSKGPETHSDGVILGLSGAGDLCASSKRVGFFSSVGNGVTSLSSCKTNLLSARGTCVGDV